MQAIHGVQHAHARPSDRPTAAAPCHYAAETLRAKTTRKNGPSGRRCHGERRHSLSRRRGRSPGAASYARRRKRVADTHSISAAMRRGVARLPASPGTRGRTFAALVARPSRAARTPTPPCPSQNDQGQPVDLYIPRKCSWTNRLIEAFDKASVQINVGSIDANTGLYTNTYKTYALSGYVRNKGESDMALTDLVRKSDEAL